MADPDASVATVRAREESEQEIPGEASLRGWPRALVRLALMAVLFPVVDLRIEGLNQVPPRGAFLLIANHLHNADPVMIQVALQRPVHFMAKQELFRVPVLKTIIELVGSFPVNRERPGRAAIRRAVSLLKSGIPIGMFPEGTRSKSGELGPAFPGAGLIAVESAVQILPVAIIGTEFLPGGSKRRPSWRPGRPLRYRVTVRFGLLEPLPAAITSAPKSSAAATEFMMTRIAALLPPGFHGRHTAGPDLSRA